MSPATLAAGSFGSAYADTNAASGGNAPYTFSEVGALPPGLSYNSAGELTGLPTTGGSFPITVTATDVYGCTGTSNYTITVACPTITVSPGSLSGGTVGVAYASTNSASGGSAPYTFSQTGSLPSGLSYNAAGELTGTPTVAGSYSFDVVATDNYGCTGTNSYNVSIGCPSITLSIVTNAIKNANYTNQIVATGVPGAFVYSVGSGLPAGLSLVSSNGILKGKATVYGTYSFTVTASNVVSTCVGSSNYTMQVTTLVADTNAPTVSMINFPANGGFVTNASVTVTSTVTDTVLVTNVEVSVDSGAWTAASQIGTTTKWKLSIGTPSGGSHTVAVRGTDLSGNTSAGTKAKTNTFFYGTYQALTIMTNGDGTVKGTATTYGTPANGANLVVGKSYKITVKPATNYLFSNLVYYATGTPTNPVTMTSTILKGGSYTFTMATGSTFIVNFVTNRFYDAAGIYNGLFSGTNVTHGSAGFVNLKTTAKLGFTGKLSVDGNNNRSFSGTFNLDGVGTLTTAIDRTTLYGKSNLTMLLQLPFDGSDTISGWVTNLDTTTNGWVSALDADRWVFDMTNHTASNYLGQYTMVLPGQNIDITNTPGGSGYGAVKITTNGTITLAGNLGDGAVFVQSTRLSKNGDWPLYVTAYRDTNAPKPYHGSIQGWVTVSNAPNNNLAGTLDWVKNPSFATDPSLYTNGFDLDMTMKASPYVYVTNIIDITNGTLVLEGGSLTSSRTNTLVITTANKFVVSKTNTTGGPSATNKPTVLISSKPTGVLSGSFIQTMPATKFVGIVLQQQKEAYGLFKSTPGSGSFLIQGN